MALQGWVGGDGLLTQETQPGPPFAANPNVAVGLGALTHALAGAVKADLNDSAESHSGSTGYPAALSQQKHLFSRQKEICLH